MDDEIKSFIKNSDIFASLDENTIEKLIPKFTKVNLAQHEILYFQGDPSDTVFIVMKGNLSADVTAITGETTIIGHIKPGEAVGEVSVLTNEPRSMTIRALKDSELLRLPAKEFTSLCHQFPAVMFETVKPLIARSSNLIQKLSTEKKNKHIVVVPAHRGVSVDLFCEKLFKHADHFSSILTLSDFQPEFHDKNADINIVNEKIKKLATSKKPSHRVLYILQSHDTPLARIAFKKADVVYIIGDTKATPKIDTHILDKIHHGAHVRINPNLILLHPDNSTAPRNTSAWLAQTQFNLHHHVRMNNMQDYQRLLRFIRGRAVGVVLSGGGTRGWAHLGALKALLSANVPIDMVGGTSVGALVGACYAMNESYEEAYEKFTQIINASEHSVSWRSLTWPTISLFNAKGFTEAQQSVFDDLQIEDMWLPFFCVSCNLTNSTEEIHRTGMLWEKTRASSSLPGIIPPMLLNGEIHLDGGLLNNLPVDIMRQYVTIKGKVIAIDLNSYAPDQRKYFFPPILTLKDSVKAKLGLGEVHYKFPSFVDTFLRSLFVGSLLKAKQNSLAANVFVSLTLTKFKLLHSNPKQVSRLIEIGYQETLLKCMYDINKKI